MKELDNDLNPGGRSATAAQNSDHSVESIATGAPLMSGHVQPLGTVVGAAPQRRVSRPDPCASQR